MKIQLTTPHGKPIVTQHIAGLGDAALLNVSELCRHLGLSRSLFVLYVKQHGFDGAVAKALARRAAKAALQTK